MKNPVTLSPTTPTSARPLAGILLPTRLLLLLLGVVLLTAPARAQSFSWTRKTTNTAGKTSVVTDSNGNTYVLSGLTGTVSVGNYNFTSYGAADLLLVKYNPAGVVQWARRIGGSGNEEAGDVDMAWGGNFLYLTGSFQSTIKFGTYHVEPVSPLTSAGKSDVFVAATFSITSLGSSDVFIAKYTKDGYFQLAGKTGGKGFDFGKAIAVNKSTGDIYVTGGYAHPDHLFTTNILLARFFPGGQIHSVKAIGTASNVDQGNDLVVTSQGVYVTGYFAGTTAFDAISLTSNGPADAFLAYYSYASGGKATWVKRYGGGGWDEGQSLAVHDAGLFLGGVFTGTATFGTTSITVKGGAADRDLFVGSFSTAGTPGWIKPMGTTGVDYGNGSVSALNKNTFLFTGSYSGALLLTPFYLTGPGTVCMRIDLPTVSEVTAINALKDYSIGSVSNGTEIDYRSQQTNQINFEVKSTFNSFASVKIKLDGVEKLGTYAPYTWAGDAPKTGGGTDYKGVTLADGPHTLEATPYAGFNGTGMKGETIIINFTVRNRPLLTGFTLVDAGTDQDVQSVKPGETIYLPFDKVDGRKFNIRAEHDSVAVGSVVFMLNRSSPKTDNTAPFTWAGDEPKSGGAPTTRASRWCPVN